MPTIFEILNCWRSIIERGRTTSTYKMALASAIAQMVDSGKKHVNKRQLAELFFEIYTGRLRVNMPQLSNPDKCTHVEQAIAGFKAGTLTREQAVSRIERDAFGDVLERFHNLDSGRAPVEFYTYNSLGLTLTDAAYQVFQSPEKDKLLREIDSRWSQIEETFARNRLGSNVSLWVAGTEIGREAQYVWCRANASDGLILGTGAGIREFTEGISDDLVKGYRVSVGFECPLSIPVPRAPKRFERAGTRRWTYSQNSPAGHRHLRAIGTCSSTQDLMIQDFSDLNTTLVSTSPGLRTPGLAETAWVMRELRDSGRHSTKPTFNWRRFIDSKSNLFLWEAVVSGSGKKATSMSTAQLAAISFLGLYPRLFPCEISEGDTPFSLGAAALMWAGFMPEEDAIRSPCVVVKAGLAQ
ncbi:MAG TPA: hypothetical protein GX529_07985 [Firmicutes bacterium]|nr:hypothetical protein [Candidatus Fermentithermobacillaceae bacterium]